MKTMMHVQSCDAYCTNRHLCLYRQMYLYVLFTFHISIAKDIYFIHSSYYSHKEMTENVLTVAVLRKT